MKNFTLGRSVKKDRSVVALHWMEWWENASREGKIWPFESLRNGFLTSLLMGVTPV
jgi:hypothetical protein